MQSWPKRSPETAASRSGAQRASCPYRGTGCRPRRGPRRHWNSTEIDPALSLVSYRGVPRTGMVGEQGSLKQRHFRQDDLKEAAGGQGGRAFYGASFDVSLELVSAETALFRLLEVCLLLYLSGRVFVNSMLV